jgi:hypothetical protein
MDMVDGDIDDAVPVLEWTAVPFVTRPAGKPSLNDDIFAAEWAVSIAACWAEYRDDRSSHGCRKVHRTGIPSNEQSRRLAQGHEFFKGGAYLAYAFACRPQ